MVQLYAYQYALKFIYYLQCRQLVLLFEIEMIYIVLSVGSCLLLFWVNIVVFTTSVVVNIVTFEASSVMVLSFSESKY